jgi:hypothetical protein
LSSQGNQEAGVRREVFIGIEFAGNNIPVFENPGLKKLPAIFSVVWRQ